MDKIVKKAAEKHVRDLESLVSDRSEASLWSRLRRMKGTSWSRDAALDLLKLTEDIAGQMLVTLFESEDELSDRSAGELVAYATTLAITTNRIRDEANGNGDDMESLDVLWHSILALRAVVDLDSDDEEGDE